MTVCDNLLQRMTIFDVNVTTALFQAVTLPFDWDLVRIKGEENEKGTLDVCNRRPYGDSRRGPEQRQF
jgi:hypothetical protein